MIADSLCARMNVLTAKDFGEIKQLASEIWNAYYVGIVSKEQIDYMLADRYTDENLLGYLNSSDRWFSLLRISERIAGYCSYASTENPGEIKLEQLYVLPELHGNGLGRLMLSHIENHTRNLNLSTLVLQVNKQNIKAISFYRKAGFGVREEAVFDIGNGFFMDDYVMEKKL